MQDMVDEFYASFTKIVREARPSITEEHFKQVTDGRIVSGERAYAVGLVDEGDEKMLGLDLRVMLPFRKLLCGQHRLL